MKHFKNGFENRIPKLYNFSSVFEHSMVTHFKIQLSFVVVGAIKQLLITSSHPQTSNYCYSGMFLAALPFS